MAYSIDAKTFLKLLPQASKKQFNFISKFDDSFFGSDAKLTKTKIWDAKVSQNNINILKKNIEVQVKGKDHDFVIDGYTFRFILSGKSSARVGDAKSTEQQELCSVIIAECVYNNKKYNVSDLSKIYPDLPNQPTWVVSFQAQEEVFKKLFSKYKQFSGNLVFNHSGGFMQWVSNKVKEFGFSAKDAWNPADMWVHTPNVEKLLKDCSSIYELNTEMRKLFSTGKLMGISLKKTGKVAKMEETNFVKEKMKSNEFLSGRIVFNQKPKSHEFVNDEFSYDTTHPEGTINVQIRMFPKKAKSNVQVSYKLKGGSAEMGKVPAAIRNAIFKDITGATFTGGSQVPYDLDSYVKRLSEYKKKVSLLIKTFDTGIKNFDEFDNNVKTIYSARDSYAQIELITKFQGIDIAYEFAKLNKKDLDILVTKWAYAAQKKGEENGPFIKIY